MSNPQDSNKHKRLGVLVTITEKDSKLHLCLDDVESEKESPTNWRKIVHYTSKPVDDAFLENLDWTDKELADFAYAILARIHAFHKCDKP